MATTVLSPPPEAARSGAVRDTRSVWRLAGIVQRLSRSELFKDYERAFSETRMLSLKLRPIPTKSVEEHRKIIDAIRKGLKVQAHNQARAHRVNARDMLLPLLERFGVKHL